MRSAGGLLVKEEVSVEELYFIGELERGKDLNKGIRRSARGL